MDKEFDYTFKVVQKIAIAALFFSLAIVFNRMTSIDIPIGGMPMLRISLGGLFINFIAILIGSIVWWYCGGAIRYRLLPFKPERPAVSVDDDGDRVCAIFVATACGGDV